MIAANGIVCGMPTASSREWVTAQRRPWQTCDHRRTHVIASAKSSRRGFGDLRDPWREEERRQALLKYVQEVQPQSVTQFAEQTPPVVVQAMRQTVLNVVGSLPPQYFSVRISTMAESLAQLMLSIMTTGYMLRSAQFRLDLQKQLKQLPARSTSQGSVAGAAAASVAAAPAAPAAPAMATPGMPLPPAVAALPQADLCCAARRGGDLAVEGTEGVTAAGFLYDGEGSPYAPGVQKKNVEGEVLRWHLARGEVERMAAADYIEMLEREVVALRAQASAAPPLPPLSTAPFTTAGGVEVLGPDSNPLYRSQGQELACVSPLPGFGDRAGPGLTQAAGDGALAVGGPVNAAAPATMGCGGIPLVVGSPLGLPRNELLDYLHGLQASGSGGFKELACSPSTASGQAVKEAMEMFVARLMGTLDPTSLSKEVAEFSSVELSKVLFWLMAVGYTLKSIEARLDMDDGSDGGRTTLDRPGGGGGPGPTHGSGGSSAGRTPGSSGGISSADQKQERKGLFSGLRGLLPGF